MPESITDQMLSFGLGFVRDAGRMQLDAFGSASRELKGPLDVVTEADHAIEDAFKRRLAEDFPSHGFVGEETTAGDDGDPAADPAGGWAWVLDPIDGTRGYVSGTPTWGVLIALRDAERVLYGMIDQPFTGERFEGGAGPAEWSRGAERRPLGVRATEALADATILTTFPEVGSPAERAAFERVAGRCRLTRHGLDCYGYALLALGQVDLVVEAGLQPYDIAAPIGVVEAAGGIVTAWDGGPAIDGGTAVAAATPALHRAALELLGG